LVCSIQYRIVRENADDAFYELANPREQIQSYVFDGSVFFYSVLGLFSLVHRVFLVSSYGFFYVVVRAHVPRIALDELFEQKGEVAKSVLEELEKVIRSFVMIISCV